PTETQSDLPIVVITFDDAHHSIYDRGFALMRTMDSSWKGSHFFPLTHLGLPDNLKLAQVQEMEAAGWENGGHGVTHENLAALPMDSVRWQVATVDSFFRANGLRLDSWAYAYGNYNDSVESIVASKVKNIRTSHDLDYIGSIDRLHLGYFAVKSEHTEQDLINRLEEATDNGARLVIFGFHVILDTSEAPVDVYYTRTPIFQAFLDYLKKREYPVKDLRDAMDILAE
ncbi:MAG TPA: polysaccharide deacetylase family protein, partial [Fibrobacteraceae bacterium]|nr:polysaccharide deacetylase family protein [Fibrobacteraceae bacterium]